jgi:hypothetical protein
LRDLVYIGMGSENGGVVLDVSEGGLAFQAIAPVQLDRTIHFSLMVAGTGRFEGTGEVAWSSGTGKICGLRFVHLPEEGREQIQIWAGQPRVTSSAAIESAPATGNLFAVDGKTDSANAEAGETVSGDPSASLLLNEPILSHLAVPDSLPERASESAEFASGLESQEHSAARSTLSPFSLFPPEPASIAGNDSAVPPRSFLSRHPFASIVSTVFLAFVIAMGILAAIYWRETYGLLSHLWEKIRAWV